MRYIYKQMEFMFFEIRAVLESSLNPFMVLDLVELPFSIDDSLFRTFFFHKINRYFQIIRTQLHASRGKLILASDLVQTKSCQISN